MQEIRKFLLRDADRNNKVYGMLIYNLKMKKFRLLIKQGYPIEEYQFVLRASLEQGYTEVPDKYIMLWVTDRIIPPNRQNIQDILDGWGLKEYDEFEMLVKVNGRCCQDAMYLEEVPESAKLEDYK